MTCPCGYAACTLTTPHRSLASRYVARIEWSPEGCWLWLGTITPNGYGQIRVSRSNRSAHRVLYEFLVGPIPEGLDLDHLCRVRRCVNPAHLEPVTRSENIRRSPLMYPAKTHCNYGHPLDGWDRTRHHRVCTTCLHLRRRARTLANTHCKHGHEFTPGTTRIEATGSRRCLTCLAERKKRRAA